MVWSDTLALISIERMEAIASDRLPFGTLFSIRFFVAYDRFRDSRSKVLDSTVGCGVFCSGVCNAICHLSYHCPHQRPGGGSKEH